MHARKKRVFLLLCAGLFGLSVGCGTLPAVYVPGQVGPVDGAERGNGAIFVRIESEQHHVATGEPVDFRVRICNRSDAPVWIPADPDLVFLWVHPDGSRDNQMRAIPESRHFSSTDVIRLDPGECHQAQARIMTQHFPRAGIVEFRAILHMPKNTNRALQPVVSGRFSSNRYGVFVGGARRSTSLQAGTTRGPAQRDPDPNISSMMAPAALTASGTRPAS